MAKLPSGNYGFELDLSYKDIIHFILTPQRIRDLARDGMISSGPGVDENWMPTTAELERICEMAIFAVNRGQMIDFGYWPNSVIQRTSNRAGRLYLKSALGHPFTTPYIILHSWDDKTNPGYEKWNRGRPETCGYLVNPLPDKESSELCIDFEALVLEGLSVKGQDILTVGDRVLLMSSESKTEGNYCARVIPYAYRFPNLVNNKEYATMITNNRCDDVMQSAAANVIDPIMVALMILNTNGVSQKVVSVSDKLNKSRIRNGKPTIPPYRQVDSSTYVTAIMAKHINKREHQGGTHASPIMHVRHGHWRNYKSGEKSFVRDTLVNATAEMRDQFISQRSHYVVK